MLLAPRIESDPEICGGRPCIQGTRFEITYILQWLEEGKSFEEILDAYPFLTVEDIKAAISYARFVIEREDVTSIEMAT